MGANRALDHLRDGRAGEALALYQAHDRLTVTPTAGGARRQLVRDWWGAGDLDDAVMIAHRRADVADLNSRARRLLYAAGALGRDELTLPGGEFSVGDRVVVKANDVRRGINNGDRAQVVALDRDGLTIETRRGGVRLGRDFLEARTAAGDPTLVHGYAITAHVAQGMTVDRAFVLAGETLDRELAYTALSRGRKSNHLYVAAGRSDAREEIAPADPFRREPVDALTARLRDNGAAALAIDTGIAASRRELEQLTRQRVAAERDHQAARRRTLDAENRWSRRLPGGRSRIEDARVIEARAGNQVGVLREREREARALVEEALQVAVPVARRRPRRERGLDRDLGLDR